MRQRKRLIATVLLAVMLVLMMSTVVSASDPLLNNSDTQTYYNSNPPSYGEKFIAGIIIGPVKWAMNLFHVSDPVLLIFNQDTRADKSDTFLASGIYGSGTDDIVLGIFPKQFFNAVTILYSAFQFLLPIPLVMMLIIMAIMHMINSGTVQGRGKIKDYVQAFVVAIVTIRFGAYIWTGIIQLNQFLVKLIWAHMLQAGVKHAFFMDMIWGTGKQGFTAVTNMGSLGMAILLILAAMMVLSLNYQYAMRIIILGLLIIIFPIAATLSIFPGFRQSLQMWFKEFVSNVILQLAHALALGGFFITLVTPGIPGGISFWLMIAYFAGMPSITILIRGMLGLQGGGGSRVMNGIGAMTGIASMAAMGRMVMRKPAGQSAGGDTGSGMMENLTGGSGSSVGSSGGRPPLTGATSSLGKGAQTAFNGASSFMGRQGVKTAGKFALGATAAIAGGALSSSMGGNAAAGAALGVGASSFIGGKGAALLGGAGGQVKGAIQTLSDGGGIKGVGQNIMAGSMQKGGMLSTAGWGLQSAVNKVSSAVGKGELFAAPSYFKGNKTMLNNANRGMEQLRPQMEMAQAKYNHAKTYFGADRPETQPSKTQYTNLKDKFSEYEADSALAQAKMRSYSELKSYSAGRTGSSSGTPGGNPSYSTGRGKV